MIRVLAGRLAAVFAVLFGLFAFGGAASAQSPDRVIYGFQAPERAAQAAPQIKKRVYLRQKGKKSYAALPARSSKAQRLAKRKMMAARAQAARAHALRTQAPRAVAARAGSTVEARVDLSAQRMVVTVGGEVAHVWHVSTARKGFVTPRGVYSPQRMHVSYFSKKYYNSPMPYSIFFRGGYAVHGTGAVKALGRPASHGCIRLATGNARTLYNLVKQFGPGRARIVIT